MNVPKFLNASLQQMKTVIFRNAVHKELTNNNKCVK